MVGVDVGYWIWYNVNSPPFLRKQVLRGVYVVGHLLSELGERTNVWKEEHARY